MNNYQGMTCPVCGEAFTAENNDVVVCPDCGTPHHRDCWKRIGHCAKIEYHGQAPEPTVSQPASKPEAPAAPEYPSAPEQTPRPEYRPPEPKVCPSCRTVNDSTASFCRTCGFPLGAKYVTQSPQAPHIQILFDPLGGVKPEEEIDGVTAGELAQVVGSNSAYYIPRFKKLAKNSKAFSLNWTALLFNLPWLFSRKMYLPAIGVLLMNLALSATTIWGIVQTYLAGTVLTFSDSFWTMHNICSVLQVVLQFAVGLFGNLLYKNHCVSMVRELKNNYPEKDDFSAAARKKGGISKFFLCVTTGLTILVYLFTLLGGFTA